MIHVTLIVLPGKFGRAAEEIRDECHECAIGTASAESGRTTSCPICATGRETILNGSTSCVDCLAGLFVDTNIS